MKIEGQFAENILRFINYKKVFSRVIEKSEFDDYGIYFRNNQIETDKTIIEVDILELKAFIVKIRLEQNKK